MSHRALDPERSRPFEPGLSHEQVELIEPGQVVPVEIEILPSSTSFEAGERLRLVVGGADIFSNAMFHHRETCNEGRHTLHLGGEHDSGLLVPFVPPDAPRVALIKRTPSPALEDCTTATNDRAA